MRRGSPPLSSGPLGDRSADLHVSTSIKVRPAPGQCALHETTLRSFFLELVPAKDLSLELRGSMVPAGPGVTHHCIVDMPEEFEVLPGHLIRACDAVLQEAFDPEYLEAIGFCLVASDRFTWDGDTAEGELVAAAVHDWAAPEINYELSLASVLACRARLLGQAASFVA